MKTKVTTGTSKQTSNDVVNVNDISNLPSVPATLETLQFLRTAKGKSDKDIHTYLDKAFAECKRNNTVLLLERCMLHIGDVSRQHNLLREMGILSPKGGAQERAIFRSCLRWWEANLLESFIKNIPIFVEFTLYENLMFYQNTTDRMKGNLQNTEKHFPCPEAVYQFLASQIRNGKDLNLIARHLPKHYSEFDTKRTTKKVIKLRGAQTEMNYTIPKNKSWFKVNGKFTSGTDGKVVLKAGDVISYPRDKQNFSLERQKYINKWITGFCKVMNWEISDYAKFRSLQNTPEQAFSSKSILNIAQSDFINILNRLTSGQRFRVAKMIAYKDGTSLKPKEKWGNLGQWYIDWELEQEMIADDLRKAAVDGDENKKKELMSQFKVKSTGMQSIDLLVEMFKGHLNPTQINNTYQSLIENMDLIANVFPIIDGSGSMDNGIVYKGVRISNRNIAYAMCIAFSTRNPVPEFQNTYGWFSAHFEICGRSMFVDESPNSYVSKKSFTKKVSDQQVLSPGKTFTENMSALFGADPKDVSSTNMFASIEYFVNLVKQNKLNVEQLPKALLYITDNENNTGKTPQQAQTLAASIGWHPLLVFWGLTDMSSRTKEQLKGVQNCLYVGGFNESALSQILRGIKSGSINPELELWSIYNDVRYSVIKS